jgi:carboxymethylenebutenolidase
MVEIHVDWTMLQVGDGTSMRAYVAQGDGKPRAGLIVLQEAFGINAHIRDVTERFAREGYCAAAPELFHRTGPGFEGSYTNFEAIMPHMRALTTEGMEADTRAAFTFLQEKLGGSQAPVACVGFCLGGRVSFLANAELPIKAAVSFYGGGIAPNPTTGGLLDHAGSLHAPQLFFWGGLDKHIGPDQRKAVMDAMSNAGKSFVNVEFSDADHGFFCDARASYNAAAAQQAWALTNAFLNLYLGI